jgi:hypothetical protein
LSADQVCSAEITPELASMVLQTRWVKHFSRTRTTTRTRTIARGDGTLIVLLAP